ncbi:unnamed protein product, partial [marine sediment metagenome]
QEKTNFAEFQTVEGRASIFMKNDQPVGIAYNRIRDALARGYANRMHFVEFRSLTEEPDRAMKAIYDFLELPFYVHASRNIECS